jgi:hypothetical protein
MLPDPDIPFCLSISSSQNYGTIEYRIDDRESFAMLARRAGGETQESPRLRRRSSRLEPRVTQRGAGEVPALEAELLCPCMSSRGLLRLANVQDIDVFRKPSVTMPIINIARGRPCSCS